MNEKVILHLTFSTDTLKVYLQGRENRGKRLRSYLSGIVISISVFHILGKFSPMFTSATGVSLITTINLGLLRRTLHETIRNDDF